MEYSSCSNCGNDYMIVKSYEKLKEVQKEAAESDVGGSVAVVQFSLLPNEIKPKIKEKVPYINNTHYICNECLASFEHEKWQDNTLICKDCKEKLTQIGSTHSDVSLWGCPKCLRVYYEPRLE